MFRTDVLIAGGGIAGMLIATRIAELGYRCVLVEPKALAAEQSGHSHGYVHRGYIYLRAEGGLVDELRTAREKWDDFISNPSPVAPCSDYSVIGFENPEVARYASETWSAAGLPVNRIARAGWPSPLTGSPLTVAYRTAEQSFDFTSVISNLRARLRQSHTVLGSVTRIYLRGKTCTGVELSSQGRTHRVNARYIVLAAGTGISSILENTLGRFQSVPNVRTSYMLVIRGKALRPLSAILPENRFYGLFMVSRSRGDETAWLVSNYLSYGGICGVTGTSAKTWVQATLRVLDGMFPFLNEGELQWGIYAAPKAEFRRDPERMPEGKVIEHLGLTNVSAVWPTKLTLGPVIAAELVGRIVDKLRDPTRAESRVPRWFHGGNMQVAPERWSRTQLFERGEFERQLGLV